MDMITEKGINDHTWCPSLWKETANDSKRRKPNREWNPMDQISKAIFDSESNNYVSIKDYGTELHARSPNNDFWIPLPHMRGKFLLAVSRIEYVDEVDRDTVTLIREPKYDPRTEEHIKVEKHLQVLMAFFLQRYFTDHAINIRTSYPTTADVETCLDEIEDEDFDEAVEWANDISGIVEEEPRIIPNTERCGSCFFKECPNRVNHKIPLVSYPKGRNNVIFSLE